jgi:hypothetical protein
MNVPDSRIAPRNPRHLPVVLMSAKGDKIRGQFVQQTGAIDAITKPFDARGPWRWWKARCRRQPRGASAVSMPSASSGQLSRPPAGKEREFIAAFFRKNSWPKRTSPRSWPKTRRRLGARARPNG